MISKEEMQRLYREFIASNSYLHRFGGEISYLEQWDRQSKKFKDFWQTSIINGDGSLSRKEINDIAIMLDCHVSGVSAEMRHNVLHVARCSNHLIPWYEQFVGTARSKTIREILDRIFKANESSEQIHLINELFRENKIFGVRWLTGNDAVSLNALMCLNDPNGIVSSVNLTDHRFKIIDYYNFANCHEWSSMGEKIVKSNLAIINGFRDKFEIVAPGILLSLFYYQCQEELGWQNHNVKDIVQVIKPKYKESKETKEINIF